jgi:hypothetical protein
MRLSPGNSILFKDSEISVYEPVHQSEAGSV